MKKQIFFVLAATVAACVGQLTSCGPAKTSESPNHTPLAKVTDYLYEISYTDLNDSLIPVMSDPSRAFITVEGACSSVRNGNFHGRNLDLFYNDMCETVVHVASSANRFASLAVCGGKAEYTPALMDSLPEELYDLLPMIVVDGINENGVVFNVNVVPGEDTAPITGTNPRGENLSCALAGRYILDHAESAAHAVELLAERNMMGSFGHYGLHFMISDETETYIVEFIDGKQVYYRGEPVANTNIMVNLFATKLPELTPNASGVERYALLQEHYDEGATLDGMARLMQRVRYTKAYDVETNPFWYSEFVGNGVTIYSSHEELMANAQASIESCRRHERGTGFWQTVNTSVYDIAARKLRLFVQEDYDKHYDFELHQ